MALKQIKKIAKKAQKIVNSRTSSPFFDFITLGSATIDIFLTPEPTETEIIKIISNKEDFELIAYPLGSKILIDSLDIEIGGGGTNSAVALKKLGFDVGFYGCIGEDENGKKIKEYLNSQNITFLGNQKGINGVSIILNSFTNERTVFTFKGSNDLLENKFNYKAKALYSASLTRNAFLVQKEIFKKAKENKTIIFYNPSSYVVKKGFDNLKDTLQYVDFLIFNKEEAMLLTKEQDIDEIFKKLIPYFKGVIITDGSNGAYFYDKEIYHIKSHKVKVLEPTGAGDAFGSTFAGFYMLTNSITEAVKSALLNAESVIQQIGPKKGLLSREELERIKMSTIFEIEKI
ncbi:MAG: carbohydrate kinase family protein [Candidatus Woesearchaeota archaeon]